MTQQKKHLDLMALASIPLLMTLGNSMLIPVLPLIEKELKVSPFQSSMIITIYSIVAIFFIPIAGYLSDRFGRKKIIILSLIITGAGGVISAAGAWFFSSSYTWIIFGRLLQGIGASGAFPVVLPLIGDLFKEKEETSHALGVIETSNTVGKVLSPIVGASLATLIWFLPFVFIPILCIIAILLVGIFVKVPKEKAEPVTIKTFFQHAKKTFLKNFKWLLIIFITGAIVMFVLFGSLFYLSEWMETKYHLSSLKKGLWISLPLIALSAASLLSGKVIGQKSELMKWLSVTGFALVCLASLTLGFVSTLKVFLIVFSVSGLGMGLLLPCLDALITENIEKEERGTLSSLYSAMRFLGVALGPPIFALMMSSSKTLMFILAAILSLVSALLFVFFFYPNKKTMGEGKRYPV